MGVTARRAPVAPLGAAAARSSLGVEAYTARIVSLNCRTLANPDAKAISVIGRPVVWSRTRAVWAR